MIAPSPMSSEQPRVLVVEDNALDRALLQAHLHRLPAEVAFADDGIEAWEMLDRDAAQYDVILLDRTMPRMNGLELLARLKADPRCRTIPVILQTGSVGREEMIEGINAGAYYYLTKPYNADVLRMVVRTAASDSSDSTCRPRRTRFCNSRMSCESAAAVRTTLMSTSWSYGLVR